MRGNCWQRSASGPSAFPRRRPRSPPSGSSAARLEAILATAGFEAADWGLLVVDRRSGAVLYEREADRLFAPADVAQLFTRRGGAEGPRRWSTAIQTPVHRRGEVGAEGPSTAT